MEYYCIFQHTFVQYAAVILFDLRLKNDKPHLEIFYKRNATTTEATPLYVPDCGYSCPLEKLYRLYDDILPKGDIAEECGL